MNLESDAKMGSKIKELPLRFDIQAIDDSETSAS
jgi:hypothetical protein